MSLKGNRAVSFALNRMQPGHIWVEERHRRHNWKAAGPMKMVCKDDTLTTTCTARRRACD